MEHTHRIIEAHGSSIVVRCSFVGYLSAYMLPLGKSKCLSCHQTITEATVTL